MRHLAVAALLATTAALVPAAAEARCGVPGATFGPPSAATVPADPTIYLFVPTWVADHRPDADGPRARAGGRDLPHTLREVSRSDAWITYAMVIESDGPGPIEVSAHGARATYRVDPTWSAPAERSAQPSAAAWEEDHWTCSFSAVWKVSLGGEAAAYRIEVGPDPAAPGHTALFPRDPHLFWETAERPAPAVELGHANCFGWTIPEADTRSAPWLRVTPLYADGSAGRTSDPFPLAGPLPPAEAAPLPHVEPPAVPPPPIDTATHEPEPTEASAPAPAGSLLGAGTGIALATAAILGLDLAVASRRGRLRRVLLVPFVAAVVIGVLAGLVERTDHPAWLVMVASAAAALTIASHFVARRRV